MGDAPAPSAIDRSTLGVVHSAFCVSASPRAISCPMSRSPRAVARHESLRIHVRSHRDRRKAVPRRGRHASSRSSCSTSSPARRSPSIASCSSPTATTRQHRPPARRDASVSAEVVSQIRGAKLIVVQVPAQGAQPRQEGSSPGADGPAHRRHRARRQECRQATPKKADDAAKTERDAPRGGRRRAGRQGRRARRQAGASSAEPQSRPRPPSAEGRPKAKATGREGRDDGRPRLRPKRKATKADADAATKATQPRRLRHQEADAKAADDDAGRRPGQEAPAPPKKDE